MADYDIFCKLVHASRTSDITGFLMAAAADVNGPRNSRFHVQVAPALFIDQMRSLAFIQNGNFFLNILARVRCKISRDVSSNMLSFFS